MREIESFALSCLRRQYPASRASRASDRLVVVQWDKYFLGDHTGPLAPPERFAAIAPHNRTWLFAGVMFPHIISFAAGLALFCLALLGVVPVSNR